MPEQLITAKWRIDLGTVGACGLRLLDFPDYLESEPQLEWRATPEGPIVAFRAANQVNRPVYNVACRIALSRVVVFDTDWQARQFLLSFTGSIPVTPMDATISYQNEAGAVVALQTLQLALIEPGLTGVTKNNRCYFKFTLLGGPLVAP